MPEPRREISWSELGELCKGLAVKTQARKPDTIVGIARGGAIVGATLSFMLNLEYFPIRLAKQGGVTRVLVTPPNLSGRNVALVDDLSRTGETFRIASLELQRANVASLFTVALVHREPGFKPDLSAMTATAADKVSFPWGREELVNGRFQIRKI